MNNINIKKEVIYINNMFKTKEEMFDTVSNDLVKLGFVYDGFNEALKKREKVYPTGIQGEKFNLAIPHAEPKYVKQSTIAIVTERNGIKFNNMLDKESEIECNLIIILILKNAEEHINVLKAVMEVIQNDHIAQRVMAAQSAIEIIQEFEILERE